MKQNKYRIVEYFDFYRVEVWDYQKTGYLWWKKKNYRWWYTNKKGNRRVNLIAPYVFISDSWSKDCKTKEEAQELINKWNYKPIYHETE